MRRFLYSILAIAMLGMVSCKEPEPQVEDPKPEITIAKGVVTENQIEFFLSATQADGVAYHFVETTDEVPMLTVEALFKGENVFAASAEPVSFVMEDLKPETEYTVYAAASKEGKYFSEIKELAIVTSPMPAMLELVSSSKTGFSYKINSEPGQQYLHTYLEGWFFEYMYLTSMAEEGDAFDPNVFGWNLLADYGILEETPQVVDWFTGKENAMRGDVAYIVPGTRYYVLAAKWNEDLGGWTEAPELISIDLEEPGQSDKTINCSIYNMSPYSVSLRMEMVAADVSFYMYDFFERSQFDAYVKENGVEGIMAYVSEYSLSKGQAKVNTYTDTWTVTPGTSYMLCVYGVDHNGDEFYTELPVDVPVPDAVLHLSMDPYERDMEGLNTYNTLKVSCTFADFVGLDYETDVFCLAGGPVQKSFFDELTASAGLSGSLEELESNGETLYALAMANMGLNPVVVDEDIYAQLTAEDSFDRIYTDLEADTEYVYMMVAFYNDEVMCRLVSAKTDPSPVEVEESEAYKAFLGDWRVEGKQTTDWSTYGQFDIRFERLTSNRSYKVYGWSTGQAGQEFPFEANFNETTGKITISTPQVLGEVVVDDKTYQVRFVGKSYSMYSDDLIVLEDYEGVAYTGRIQDQYLMLSSEFFLYANEWKEFKSMSYVLYDPVEKTYHSIEEYDLVYFQTQRAQ